MKFVNIFFFSVLKITDDEVKKNYKE